MPRRVLDTNILINFWGRKRGERRATEIDIDEATEWAEELIGLHGTNALVTPIYIEYLCGKGSEHEIDLARAFLEPFDLVDEGRILPEDWEDAKRIASRVPRDGSRRQMGDCVIRAICLRHLEVFTSDRVFRTEVANALMYKPIEKAPPTQGRSKEERESHEIR